MSYRGKRFNGILVGFVITLVTLLILGIVTGKIVFYILFGILLLFAILGVIGLFTFLKKTGQETPKARRSTYDISKGQDYAAEDATKTEIDHFCDSCGKKLESGEKTCSNCGKSLYEK